jgi:hypothetical protein
MRERTSMMLLAVLTGCAGLPAGKPAAEAANGRAVTDLLNQHLRALEAGDWKMATDQLSTNFSMQLKGMPFFVTIPRANALDMHRARKRAFPDFRFNEQIEGSGENWVRVAVFLSGTHTGLLDYPVKEVPKLEATGRAISLPAEYFTYFFEHDHITRVFGEIPEGHGPPALKKQLGVDASK